MFKERYERGARVSRTEWGVGRGGEERQGEEGALLRQGTNDMPGRN